MKFTNKVAICLLIVVISSVCDINASKVSRVLKKAEKAKKDPICTTVVTIKDKKPVMDKGENKNDYDVFPMEGQTGETVTKNTMTQSKAARGLLYKPSAAVKEYLKKAATNYSKFYSSKKEIDVYDALGKEERQTNRSGTWQVYYSILKLLGMKKKDFSKKDFHEDAIGRIKLGKEDATAVDYLGFLGLLGDIGSKVQDYVNREDKRKKDSSEEKVTNLLFEYFGKEDLTAKSQDFYAKYSPDSFFDKGDPFNNKKPEDWVNHRKKKTDRKTCFDATNTKDAQRKDQRFGLMNSGNEVDALIDAKDGKASALPAEKKLPGIGWPWQTIPKNLIDFCPDEPWAGHFSGSLYELILMFELLDRDDPKAKVEPDSAKKKLFAGIASAFLIATGMHSAVEVVYVDKLYTGAAALTPDKILSKEDVCTNASDYVAKLIASIRR